MSDSGSAELPRLKTISADAMVKLMSVMALAASSVFSVYFIVLPPLF